MPGMANPETAKALAPTTWLGRPQPEGSAKTPRRAPAGPLVEVCPKEIDLSKLEFIGCDAVPMTREQYRDFEGRLEVWDAELKTAWMVRELLLARGLEVSDGFLADRSEIAEIPVSAVISAALACDGEQDFLPRLAVAGKR